MKLYKYKSLSPNTENALDMIVNQRLYCSSWRAQNDPMEGVFAYVSRSNQLHEDNINQKLNKIKYQKDKLRICSLSEVGTDYDAYLMWAHYADGFKGIALEIDLDELETFPVTYVNGFPTFKLKRNAPDDEYAKRVLSHKMSCWSYERERRIITDKEFYDISGKITKVIIGHRAKDTLRDVVKSLCKDKGIPACTTGLGDEGVDFDRF